MAGESDRAFGRALQAAVAALAVRRDGVVLGHGDLRDALGTALRGEMGRLTMVIPDDAARLKGWPEGIAVVDLGVRGRLAGRQRAVAACAWWDAGDGPATGLRGACRVASATRDGAGDGYLVAAGPEAAWEGDSAWERLFRDGERATLPLLRDAGVEAVAEGPALVPGRLRSVAVGRAPLDPAVEGWQVRAVRLEPAGGDLQIA